jgi:asparagine synthase (glutamine-hydrolysing)
MGAYFLVRADRKSDLSRCCDQAKTILEKSGFGAPKILTDPGFTLFLYPKLQFSNLELSEYPNGDFSFVCGTFMFRGLLGAKAADAFYREFAGDRRLCDEAYGHFTLILRKNGRLYLLNDRFGGHHVFSDAAHTIVSSSFLVVSAFQPALTVLKQSVFEYVFNGVVSGNATMFGEVSVLPKDAYLVIDGPSAALRCDPIAPPTRFSDKTREELLGEAVADLDGYFGALAQTFGNRINTALSGGYDSRLILAMLRRHGVAPRLYVYGPRGDGDVELAQRIAEGEGLELDWIDKDVAHLSPEEFPEIVSRNYLATDGYGWGGIFSNGAELGERYRRTANGTIALNGGGGEIYRNFFYLRDGSYRPRALLWSFWGQFDPRQCTALFDEAVYYRNLKEKMFELLGGPRERLPRPTIEWLYHGFRCRSWDGKVNTINNRFGHTALPFLDHRITEHASRIPLAMKNHGGFEAELIRRIDPRLAGYPSNYGHDFAGPPPLRHRLRDLTTYLRPTALRRLTFRLKHSRRGASSPTGYLAPKYVATVLPGGCPLLGRLFKIEAVSNEQHLARILSLEYAFAKMGNAIACDF